jgi:hypothetical protein
METKPKTSLQRFYNLLSKHDWDYEYSDDFSVWKSGGDQRRALEEISLESDTHHLLFKQFYDHKKGKGEKPELPKED